MIGGLQGSAHHVRERLIVGPGLGEMLDADRMPAGEQIDGVWIGG